MTKKVIVGMSGGVDSAVTALLLKEAGYEVTGVTLQLWTGGENFSAKNAADAASVADLVGVAHEVVNFEESFRRDVIGNFIETYLHGGTPNPGVECNRHIKFKRMLIEADRIGADYVATGHYARVEKCGDRDLLKRASDVSKDQTYVLCSLTQAQLSRVLFPLGQYTKPEVRAIAEKNGFVNAHKQDSQDICFIPDGDYAAFIESYTGKRFPQGNFIDREGNVLGKHNGIIRYTVGQRKGLGISLGKPAFVCAKDVSANTVMLGTNEDLFSKTLTARQINLIACDVLDRPTRVTAKIRYQQSEQPATVIQTDESHFRVDFDSPQRAIACGQSVVLYDGDTVVGGGIIE